MVSQCNRKFVCFYQIQLTDFQYFFQINNKLVTPKKSKHDSRMVMPLRESPAGPQAVRTSSFAMMGYVIFSVQAINKKVWSLNNVSNT